MHSTDMFSHHARHVPAPPRQREPIYELRITADIAREAYERGLDQVFSCTRPPHRHGHSGRACAACAEARVLRLDWLRAERKWVDARNDAQVIDTSLYVELDAAQSTELIRSQPTWTAS